MAKPIASRFEYPSKIPPGQPTLAVTPVSYWNSAKGLDYTRRISRIDVQHAAQITNLRITDSVLETRLGTSDIGGSGSNIMNVVSFLTNTGKSTLLRFTTTVVQLWTGSTWITLTGISAFTGGLTDFFTWTAYNNRLVFSNGVDGLFEFNPTDYALQKIVDGPAARQLSTFAGRIIASNVLAPTPLPSRIQWSAKNNSHDWTGIGSGFDDLLDTPGGVVDVQRGVFPLSDAQALIVRSSSLWQMTETGDPDAPFRFGQIYNELGSDATYSIVRVPGGIIGLFKDDVYIIDGTTPKSIGNWIRHQIINNVDDLAQVWGTYDFERRRYFLRVREGSQTVIYEYSLFDDSWCRHIMGFNVRSMASGKSGTFGLTIDSSTGFIDDAGALTIDSEVGVIDFDGLVYATSDATGYVVKDDASVQTDSNGVGATVPIPLEIRTGLLMAATPLESTYVIEVDLEYEAVADLVMAIEYSSDKGATWTNYSTFTAQATNGPRIVRCARTIRGHNIQFRLVSPSTKDIKIIAFVPFLSTGERVAKGQP